MAWTTKLATDSNVVTFISDGTLVDLDVVATLAPNFSGGIICRAVDVTPVAVGNHVKIKDVNTNGGVILDFTFAAVATVSRKLYDMRYRPVVLAADQSIADSNGFAVTFFLRRHKVA